MSLYETKLLTLFHLRLDVSNFLVLQYKRDQNLGCSRKVHFHEQQAGGKQFCNSKIISTNKVSALTDTFPF